MGREWTFGKRVAFGFGVSAVVLVLLSAIGYLSTNALIANDSWVKHSYEVRRIITRILSNFSDAETGQRGFILTGRPEYLEPFEKANLDSDRLYDDLRGLTADNPNQVRRVEALRPLMDSRLSQLQQGIDLRRQQDFEAAQKYVLGGQGKETMDEIRALLEQMDQEERGLLESRQAQSQTSTGLTKLCLVGGSVLGVLAISLVGWLTTNALTQQIGSAVGKVQSSSAELQAVAKQQATSAKEQSSAMSEIATTLSELLATSRQIAESAVRVSQIAEQSAGAARSGDVTVERSRESMAAISRQVDTIVSHMLELGKKSQHIGTVVEIVSELAEQTNILAINATIEAAGAGEAGKRFAVVADEIRKLAERVTGSTKEIRALIDDVRGAVNTTVMATESGSKSVEAGSRHFSELAASFQQIASVSLTTTDAAREIELSTKQQSTAVEQVNVAISNVAQATRETEASSGQTFQTASQLAILSKDLMRIIRPDAVLEVG